MPPPPHEPPPAPRGERLVSLDLLRGVVMVLMALDHVRDFFTSARFDPLDLARTTPGLYLTRWITHLCAPVFVALAGTSAYLVAQRRGRAAAMTFLWTRGAWLLLLEATVVHWGWTFDFAYRGAVHLQVIWALGWSMVALSLAARLPVAAVGGLGALLVLGHNALDGVRPEALGVWGPLWRVLHVPGPLTERVVVMYPLVPWIGVMALGYAAGALYVGAEARRRRTLLALGAGAVVAFLVLRGGNLYGDAEPWTPQSTPLFTVFSFLDTVKYPPSLLYLLMTLGPASLFLAAAERAKGALAATLVTIGRVPLFFYVLHLHLAHLLAATWLYATQGSAALFGGFADVAPPTWGYDLGGVYLAWLVVLVLLFPACRWFSGVKATRRTWWLSYV